MSYPVVRHNGTDLVKNSGEVIPIGDPLPDQSGHTGEFLQTDGTDPSWQPASGTPLPDQTGHDGEYLTTDGADASWGPLVFDGGIVVTNPYPAAPPTSVQPADLYLWLKSDTIALSNGNPVPLWEDQSGNGNDATSSGAARPTFKTNQVNGLPVVSIGDNGIYMDFASHTLAKNYSIFMVVKATDLITDVRALGEPISPFDMVGFSRVTGSPYLWASMAGVSTPNSFTVAVPSSDFAIDEYIASGGAPEFYQNGFDYGAGPPGSNSFYISRLGSDTTMGGFDVAEIVVYTSALSSDDRTLIEGYLANKYGLINGPLPNIQVWNDRNDNPVAVLDGEGSFSIAGTFESDTLTASRAVVTNSSKELVSSAATDVEVGYLSGVSSGIQGQLNGKQASLGLTFLTGAATITFATTALGDTDLVTGISFPGVVDGDAISLGVVNADMPSGCLFFGWASGNDVISIRLANINNIGGVTPTNVRFKFTCFK